MTDPAQGTPENKPDATNEGAPPPDAKKDVQHASWHEALPADLKESASLKRYTKVDDLASAYLSLEKTMGANNKLSVPDKHATEKDWKEVFQKLGLPESQDKYDVKFEDGSDPEFTKEFKELAYKNNLLPAQAQKLVEWYTGKTKSVYEQTANSQKSAIGAAVEALKKELGQAYDSSVQKAKGALLHYAGEDKEMVKFLNETKIGDTPLASHPMMVKTFLKVAASMKEGQFKGETFYDNSLSPQQAMQKANVIIGDLNHPYHNKMHPSHSAAVKEVSDLFAMSTNA